MKTILPLCALLTLALVGCTGTTTNDVVEGPGTLPSDTTAVSFTAYCGTCGHGINGEVSDHKCDSDHATCENCPFHKGSELCCKDVKDAAGKFFCAKCGEEAGTEACCKDGAETCEDCPFHKGSALCCKLAKADDTPADDTPADDTPADDTPADDTPADDTPADDTPADDSGKAGS